MKAIQIHHIHEISKKGKGKIQARYRIDAEIKQIPIYFKIYTDADIDDLEPLFFEWVKKTKTHTASSLCRFLRKKDRSVKVLTDNQYLNWLLSKKKFKKYF